jgi:hypothetical protein
MEVASGGEMYTRLTSEGRYEEPIACNLYSQLVSAVEYMVRAIQLNGLISLTCSSNVITIVYLIGTLTART